MKNKQDKTKTEQANIALDKAFYGEQKEELPFSALVNNNNTALVLSDIKSKKDNNEEDTLE